MPRRPTGVVRIARALNEAGVPCRPAADPERNPHRTGSAWTLETVTTILGNPRYTGRHVWNRQRTDAQLADPANTRMGHKRVPRWKLPDGWVISARPAHPALVSEADFIAAQNINAGRGPASRAKLTVPEQRQYLLAGFMACGTCGRLLLGQRHLERVLDEYVEHYNTHRAHRALDPRPGRHAERYSATRGPHYPASSSRQSD